ncbi:MAG: ThuA domain-containing protein [Planctomycetota bacterium]|nr:ThuA domain-containing protein [Planctomycetota bacterium]
MTSAHALLWLVVFLSVAAVAGQPAPSGPLVGASVEEVPKHQQDPIVKAAPDKPRVQPKAPRKVLIWITPAHLMDKDPHKGYCLPYGTVAMKALGEKSGAFTPVISNDLAMFLPDELKNFDAIVLQNTAGAWMTPGDEAMPKLKALGDTKEAVEQALRKGLLEYVKSGHGIMGTHFAIAGNPKWDEFHEMMGGNFTGHPWNEDIGIKVEEPEHPLVAAFDGKDFRLADEIYQFGKPYSRENLRVLLSVDTERTNMGVKWIDRPDNDFAQAWVRSYGKGRVFYTGFGHRIEIYTSPKTMQFFLDGIQFICGDIDAPTEPRASRPKMKAPGPTPPETREAKMKERTVKQPDQQELQKIEAAAPAEPQAKPAKRRRVLVWGHSWAHTPNAYAEEALKTLGKKTGAFDAVVSDDPRLLLGDRINQFDALVMNNIHEGEPFLPEDFGKLGEEQKTAAKKFDAAVKKSILEFVRGGVEPGSKKEIPGKGIVGIHASNCALQGWKEYLDMMGGTFGGYILQELAIKPEDAAHPVNACFESKTFKLNDEIYIFTDPYSRKNLRVIVSLDPAQMKFPEKIQLPRQGFEQGRPDKDHAISWVRSEGKGRVFYTTLGHEPATYWNPLFLRHLLAGVQFAIGDLPGETAPSAQ